MIVEKLVESYIPEIEDFSPNIYRASLVGKCPRRLTFQKFGIRGQVSLRGQIVLADGEEKHRVILTRIKKLWEEGALSYLSEFITEDEMKFFGYEQYVKIGRFNFQIHPDAYLRHESLGLGVLEFKTLSNFSFKRATRGEIDRDYIAQMAVYVLGLNADFVIFLGYRKETSHFVEILMNPKDSRQEVRVMTNNPYGIILIETPFNFDFQEVIEKYEKIESISDPMDALRVFPEPVNHYACDNCNGTGVKPYGKCRSCKGTGRKEEVVLKYPCSYCPYWVICYPNGIMEFDEDYKPKIKIGG